MSIELIAEFWYWDLISGESFRRDSVISVHHLRRIELKSYSRDLRIDSSSCSSVVCMCK